MPADDAARRSELAEVQELLKAGRYAEAEERARKLLARAEPGAESPQVMEILDLLVESLYRGGKASDAKSRALAERAVAHKEQILGAEHPELARSLVNLASLLRETGDYPCAQPLYERSLAIRETALGSEHPDVATILNLLAGLLHLTGEYGRARSLHERALAIREGSLQSDHTDLAESLDGLASLLRDTGEHTKARPLHERALAIREEALGPDHPLVAHSLNGLGRLLFVVGDYARARPLHERALAISERALGLHHPLVAHSLNSLGVLLFVVGDYAGARPLYERAVAIRERALGLDHPLVAASLNNLALLFYATGDYSGAGPLLERAGAILEKALGPNHRLVAVNSTNLAILLEETGDFGRAQTLFERALSICEKALGPDHPEVAGCLTSMANVLGDSGNYAAAQPLHERALAIQEKAVGPNHPDVALCLDNLGQLHHATGDHASARLLCERALAIREEAFGPDHRDTAASVINLASFLCASGQYASARQHCARALPTLERALGRGHPHLAQASMTLALINLLEGCRPEALASALRTEEIGRSHLRLTSRGLSESQAHRYARIRISGLPIALTLAGTGLASHDLRRVWDAQIRSRAVLLDEMAARHRTVAGAADPAIDSLWAGVRNVRSRLANLTVRGLGSMEPESYRKLLEDTDREKEKAEQALAAKSAIFQTELARSEIGLEQVLASLPEGALLLAYCRYEEPSSTKPDSKEGPRYLAFIGHGLTPGSHSQEVRAFALGDAELIDDQVQHWRREIARPELQGFPVGEASYRPVGEALRTALWDPVASELKGASTVFIVPDGPLHLVNFSALPDGDAGYLIENGPLLHYLSAERDLVPDVSPKTPGRGLLALGDPDYDRVGGSSGTALVSHITRPAPELALYRGPRSACGEFSDLKFWPLPGSAEESKDVEKRWKKTQRSSPVLALRQAAADETTLKRAISGRRVVHLATHGFFLGEGCLEATSEPGSEPELRSPGRVEGGPPLTAENPLLLSGLALAGANRRHEAGPLEDDGILTAEEVGALDLTGTEWVVLSACGTGLGEVRSGEGVFGLRRAFEVAGARTLIMSLWTVTDERTRRWMDELYRARLEEGKTTAESVRQASLTLLREQRRRHASTHPALWAAFIATGEWR